MKLRATNRHYSHDRIENAEKSISTNARKTGHIEKVYASYFRKKKFTQQKS